MVLQQFFSEKFWIEILNNSTGWLLNEAPSIALLIVLIFLFLTHALTG